MCVCGRGGGGSDSKPNIERLKTQLLFIATVWGSLNNSDRPCMDTLSASMDSLITEDAKCPSPANLYGCQPWTKNMQRKGSANSSTYVFCRQENVKAFKLGSLVVYPDPVTDMLLGPIADILSTLSKPPKKEAVRVHVPLL